MSKIKIAEVPDPPTFEQIQESIRRSEEERLKYNEELPGRAKKRDELIESIDCHVEEVYIKTNASYQRTETDIFLRRQATRPRSQVRTLIELLIDSDIPVNKLYFNGIAHLEKGDEIRAYVFRANKEYFKEKVPSLTQKPGRPTFYTEREWQEEELAFKIEKIIKGEVVATYEVG